MRIPPPAKSMRRHSRPYTPPSTPTQTLLPLTLRPSRDGRPAPARPERQAPPERQERIPLAIFLMISAGAIFSFSSAASKILAETYPVGEVLFTRVLVSFVLFSAFALPTAGIGVFHTRRPTAHVLRSMSQFTSQTLLL